MPVTMLITNLKIPLPWKRSFSENHPELLISVYCVLQNHGWTILKLGKDGYNRLGSPFACLFLTEGITTTAGHYVVLIVVLTMKLHCSRECSYNLSKIWQNSFFPDSFRFTDGT